MSRLAEILALPKVTHNLVQGTPAWHQFRMEHRGASEAAATLGLSKNMKRSELLHMKHTGLAREFSDWLQRNVLDKGHEVEAKARPLIEQLIGDDLYPVTCSRGNLSASCDGLTMEDRVAFEHKQWAEDLAAMVAGGIVPDEHMPQCAQVLLVTGAEEMYFTVSDGTPERMVWAKVTREDALPWMERVVAGWDQFDADLATYTPAEIKEMPKAEVTLALPVLFIHAKGEITTSNMQEYGAALAKRLAEVRAIALITDQDFSNAKESAKLLRENIQQAKLAKEAMLAQTVTVGEAARMIDTWCEDMRLTALKLEQDVEREDKAKKAAMIAKAKADYEAHIDALKADTGGPWIQLPAPNWPEALKSKRSYASMQDALDTMLANAKIAADDSARKIRAALACMDEEGRGYEFLLSDRLTHISKPVEDVRMLVRARITEHKAAEERRLEAERQRIRAEEEAKARATAEREQRERQEAEDALIQSFHSAARRIEADTVPYIQKAITTYESTAKDWENDPRERVRSAYLAGRDYLKGRLEAAERRQREEAEAERRRQEANAAGSAAMQAISEARAAEDLPEPLLDAMEQAASGIIADMAITRAAAPAVFHFPTKPEPAAAPTLRLGDVQRHMAPLTITAEGLRELGFEPAGRDKRAILYHASELPYMLTAASQHLAKVRDQLPKAA